MLLAEKLLNEEQKKEVMELRVSGKTYPEISAYIARQYDIILTPENIGDLFNKREEIALKVLNENKQLDQHIAKQYVDVITQFKELNKEMWNYYYELRSKQDKDAIKIADHIFRQLQHADRIAGRLENKTFNIQINKVELTKNIVQLIALKVEQLEKKGVISIKAKKRLHQELNL